MINKLLYIYTLTIITILIVVFSAKPAYSLTLYSYYQTSDWYEPEEACNDWFEWFKVSGNYNSKDGTCYAFVDNPFDTRLYCSARTTSNVACGVNSSQLMQHQTVDDCTLGTNWDNELQQCAGTCESPLTWDGNNCSCPISTDQYYSNLEQCLPTECNDGNERSELTGLCSDDCILGESFSAEFGSQYPPGTICAGAMGCEAHLDTVGDFVDGSGQHHYAGVFEFTGYGCSGGADSDYSPFTCDPGEVKKSCPGSSVTYCMPPYIPLECDNNKDPVAEQTDSTPGKSDPSEVTSTSRPLTSTSNNNATSTTTTTDNGDGTSTKVTTTQRTTEKSDGSRKVTTSVLTDDIDNATGRNIRSVLLESEEVIESDYETSVTGNNQCKKPPTCDGDAIDCAQLFNTWETKCLLKKTIDYCTEDPTAPECKDLDAKEEELPINEQNLEFDLVEFTKDNQCPEFNIDLISMGLIDIEIDLVCDFMSGMKPFVLISAWLSAAYLIFGGRRT